MKPAPQVWVILTRKLVGDFQPQNDKKLIEHYERRLDRSFLSDHAGCRTTLRQAITNQVQQFKSAIQQGTEFRAFRLN